MDNYIGARIDFQPDVSQKVIDEFNRRQERKYYIYDIDGRKKTLF